MVSIESLKSKRLSSKPTAPPEGYDAIYTKTDGLYTENKDGAEVKIGPYSPSPLNQPLQCSIDSGDGTTAIAAGDYIDIIVPKACTITGVRMKAKAIDGQSSGSIVIDVWRKAALGDPSDADSITASAPPTISNALNSTDTMLTGWTKTLAAYDVLRLNVDSCTNLRRVAILLDTVTA